jgi:hypothetical protein
MKYQELLRDTFLWRCESPTCQNRRALQLLVLVHTDLLCPDCLAEHERRIAQRAA